HGAAGQAGRPRHRGAGRDLRRPRPLAAGVVPAGAAGEHPHDQGGPAPDRHLGPRPPRGRPRPGGGGTPMPGPAPPRIAISALGPDAAARGAAGLVTARMLARPGALMSASARAEHREMPKLALGPLLRYVGETQATVWVETDAAARVEVAVSPATDDQAAAGGAPGHAPALQVQGHHSPVVLIGGLAPDPFPTSRAPPDGEPVWPEPVAAPDGPAFP